MARTQQKPSTNGKIIPLTVRFSADHRSRLHAYASRLGQIKGSRVSYSAAIKHLIETIPEKQLDQAALKRKSAR